MHRLLCPCSKRFGLTLSIKKTEVLRQVQPSTSPEVSNINVGGASLQFVDKFCYLGSIISSDGSLDGEISQRIAKASAALGRLRNRPWNEDGVHLRTKIDVYRAVVLSILLYSCETWTIYRRHVHSRDKFHLRCLRQITGIKWQEKIPNTEVLECCKMTGIEAFLGQAQLSRDGPL